MAGCIWIEPGGQSTTRRRTPMRPALYLALHRRAPRRAARRLRKARVPHALLGEEAHELGLLQGRAAIIALELVTALVSKQVELVLVLDAFGDDAHPQAVRQGDHRARDGHVVGIVRQGRDE